MQHCDPIVSPFKRHFTFVFLLALMGVTAVIDVHGVDRYYYSFDELMHLDMARANSFGQMMEFSHYETHPPLGNLLRYYWLGISDKIWFVRGLSLLFGLALIPLYYAIGRLLNGPFTGICCAFFVAFSYGIIIQSYIVRNYTILVFFLSLCLFAYLHWKDSRKLLTLLGYSLAGILTCSTHFSGLFGVFSIAAYEMLRLLKSRAPLKTITHWAVANIVPALVSLYWYMQWRNVLAAYAFAGWQVAPLSARLTAAAFYPFMLSDTYLLPGFWTLYLLALSMPLAFALNPRFHAPLNLAGNAFAVGMLLMVSGIYSDAFGRHGLWLLPFLVAACGMALAICCERLAGLAGRYKNYPYLEIMAIVLLFVGAATYDPAARFNNSRNYWEYAILQKDWKKFQYYLAMVPSNKTLVWVDRTILFMTSESGRNPYAYFPPNPFSPDSINVMPLYHMRMIFDASWHTFSHPTDRFSTELGKKALASAEQVVFVTIGWGRSNVENILLCNMLDKTVVTFPALPDGTVISKDNITRIPVILAIVPKQKLMDDFMSPQGKAHGCMH